MSRLIENPKGYVEFLHSMIGYRLGRTFGFLKVPSPRDKELEDFIERLLSETPPPPKCVRSKYE